MKNYASTVLSLTLTLSMLGTSLSSFGQTLIKAENFNENLEKMGNADHKIISLDRSYLQADLDHLAIVHTYKNTDKLYAELLRRFAHERLIESAYISTIIAEDEVHEGPLYKGVGAGEARYPGLHEKLSNLRIQASQNFDAIEVRRAARTEVATVLVNIAEDLQAKHEELKRIDEELKSTLKSEKQLISDLEDEKLSVAIDINNLMSLSPFISILMNSKNGPKNATSSWAPIYRFSELPSQENALFYKLGDIEVDRSLRMMDAEKAILQWIPAWNSLIRESAIGVDLQDTKEVWLTYDVLRTKVDEAVKGTFLEAPIKEYLEKQLYDWGLVGTSLKKLNSHQALKIAEGVILETAMSIQLPVLLTKIGIDTANNAVNKHFLIHKAIAGAYLGWSNLIWSRTLQKEGINKEILVGAAHMFTAFILRSGFSFLNASKKVLPGTQVNYWGTKASDFFVKKLERSRLGRSYLKFLSGPTTNAVQETSKSRIKQFVAKHGAALGGAAESVTASMIVTTTVSMHLRDKSLKELIVDPNFRRDILLGMILDFGLAYYSSSGKPYIMAAPVLGSAAFLAVAAAQQLSSGEIDLGRCFFYFTWITTSSYLRMRGLFSPASNWAQYGLSNLIKGKAALWTVNRAASIGTMIGNYSIGEAIVLRTETGVLEPQRIEEAPKKAVERRKKLGKKIPGIE